MLNSLLISVCSSNSSLQVCSAFDLLSILMSIWTWLWLCVSRDWRACKNRFFMLTTFLAPGIFSIHDIWKKIKKWPEPNIFLYPKINYAMSVNHAKEFLKYVLYFHTFLSELQMAASIPISGISVPNLVQGHLRTWSWLIWVTVLILIWVGLY